MEEHIRKAINDDVIKKAAKLYDASFNDVVYIGGFENFVYEITKGNTEYILRLAHSDHRKYNEILAEIEFIDYLSKNGANVSQVIKTNNNELSEVIKTDNGKYFTATLFTKAFGTFVTHEDRNPDFFRNFGAAVGKLHKLTKDYQPTHKREHWHEELLLEKLKDKLDKKDMFIYDKYIALKKELMKLPVDEDSYGLIHTDLHFGNMYLEEGELTFFDWDDASYKHFISDIAIIIFYLYAFNYNLDNDKKGDYTYLFLKHFCEGYLAVNDLDFLWFDHLIKFLKLREIVLYGVIMLESEEFRSSEWAKNYISFYHERIRDDIPFLNIDRALGNNRKTTNLDRGAE